MWTSIFEWSEVMCGSRNGHQKDMCSKEIGLCAPNMLSVLGSNDNIIGWTYMSISWALESLLWYWIGNSYDLRKLRVNYLQARLIFANHLALRACFISYEKWVQRQKCLIEVHLPYHNNWIEKYTLLVRPPTLLNKPWILQNLSICRLRATKENGRHTNGTNPRVREVPAAATAVMDAISEHTTAQVQNSERAYNQVSDSHIIHKIFLSTTHKFSTGLSITPRHPRSMHPKERICETSECQLPLRTPNHFCNAIPSQNILPLALELLCENWSL